MRHFSGEFNGMRLLMADELLLIAGGEGEDTDDVQPEPEPDDIVVNGVRLDNRWYYSPPQMGGGGTGGDQNGPEDDYEDAKDTPCVETAFAGSSVTTDRANDAAKTAATAIRNMGDSAHREYGAFIYEYGGHVLFTPPFTSGQYGEIGFDTSKLPQGAHVLGIIHNHPYSGDVDQRYPSSADWNVFDTFAGKTINGKTFDSNMLNYITSNQDNSVRPYDKTDKNQHSPACAL